MQKVDAESLIEQWKGVEADAEVKQMQITELNQMVQKLKIENMMLRNRDQKGEKIKFEMPEMRRKDEQELTMGDILGGALASQCLSLDGALAISPNKKANIIEVLEGDSRMIHCPNSDVLICTPKGAHGMLFGTIHTNPQPFLHLIPESDCLIAPICEFSFQPHHEIRSPEGLFTLLIPHTVKDIEKVKGHIRVQHVTRSDEDKEEAVSLLPPRSAENIQDLYWECNSTHVIVHTPDFCDIIVTAEGLNCCAQTAELLVFGKWVKFPGEKPRVDLNTFFGSKQCQITDYLMTLKIEEAEVGRHLVNRREIPLTVEEEYMPGRCEVTVSVQPQNQLNWKPFNNMPLNLPKNSLPHCLPYDGTQHICKKPHKQLEFFHLESENLETTHFTGVVSVEVTTRGQPSLWEVVSFKEPQFHTTVIDIDDLKCAKCGNKGIRSDIGSIEACGYELTASGLWNLAKRVTSEEDLLTLAIEGLQIKETHTVLSHINDHKNSINVAAFQVLEDWKKTEQDLGSAYTSLKQALDRAGKPEWKSALHQ